VSRRRFHHLVVEHRSTLPVDPAGRLLGPLPEAGPGEPVDLLVETRTAGGPSRAGAPWRIPAAGDLAPHLPVAPSFVHGDLEVRIADGTVEICWPRARFTVDAGPVPRALGVVDEAVLGSPLGLHAVAQVPTLIALAAALRARAVFHLHAACLVLPGERTVLVPALAGAGKSTLAAALVATGAGYLGDDTVFVVRRGHEVRLLALPREFHLAPRSARAVGLEEALDAGHETLAGKRRLDAEAAFPGRFRWEAAAPSLILLPRITGEPITRLEPAGPADALGLLLESSALVATRGLPGGQGHLPLLGELADGARVLRAELGLDLMADGAAVARRIAAEMADA
jgi:hypothetical protein